MRAPSRRLTLLAFAVVAASLAVAIPSFGSVSTDSGFEAADANLVSDGNTDWNSFNPVSWTGTAPYRTAVKNNGWSFKGFEDAAVSTTDSGFAGGVKQDDDCATLKNSKAPNKDDLKRVYLATQTINSEVYLVLAWVRIPQNSVTASAHIGYEFNQGSTPCSATSPLVKRTGGDMLIVYDFAGGSDLPDIKLSRWLTTTYNPNGATCEVNNSTVLKGCWGDTKELTALNFAEGKVNTDGSVFDAISPNGSNPGIVEFGEAGINLTDAGVFSATTCEGFGNVYAVSRSSGSSSQAAMMDLVGPGAFSVNNCASVAVKKSNNDGGNPAGAVFTLYEGANTSGTVVGTCTVNASGDCLPVFEDLQPGTYTVDETTVPAGYTKDPNLPDTFTLAPEDELELAYVNRAVPGTVEITKVDDAGNGVPGATFTIYSPAGISNGAPTGTAVASCTTTGTSGTCTITNVNPGTYTIDESVVPPGYAKDSTFPKNITVGNAQTVPVSATDPRKFKMIVLVCREHDSKLHSSSVTINGDARPASLTAAGASAAGLSESALCGLTAGAKAGLLRSGNPQSASVTIPANP